MRRFQEARATTQELKRTTLNTSACCWHFQHAKNPVNTITDVGERTGSVGPFDQGGLASVGFAFVAGRRW